MGPLKELEPWGRAVLAGLLFLTGCFHPKPAELTRSAPVDFSRLVHFAELSQAAYEDEAAIRRACGEAYEDIHVADIPEVETRYFLATSHGLKMQVIAVRGTATLKNALLDADLVQKYPASAGVRVHRGFARTADAVYADVKPRLLDGYKVSLTGHSLGGAAAVVLAMYLRAEGRDVAEVVTYGQPKVTDKKGAARQADLPLLRVAGEKDIVPFLPPSDMIGLYDKYRHLGPEVVLFDGPEYGVAMERFADAAVIDSFWRQVQDQALPEELKEHFIATYLERLREKLSGSREAPLEKGGE